MTPELIYRLNRIEVLNLRERLGLGFAGAGEELAWRLAVGFGLTLIETARLTGREVKDIRKDCRAFSARRLGTAKNARLAEMRRAFAKANQDLTSRELATTSMDRKCA